MISPLSLEAAICIWDYDHLPEAIKEFMQESGISTCDADWFAVKPPVYKDEYIPWLELPAFGCCDVKEYPIGTMGYMLVVGYHA